MSAESIVFENLSVSGHQVRPGSTFNVCWVRCDRPYLTYLWKNLWRRCCKTVYLTNRKWFSVVCTVVDNVIRRHSGLFVYLFVIYLFEQFEVLAAIQLMWTCYTHPPIHSRRTATTPGTSSPTLLEYCVGCLTSHRELMNIKDICETRLTVYSPCPRRLESLTICGCYYKGSTFSSVILRRWVLVQPESNSRPPAWQPGAQPTEPPVRGQNVVDSRGAANHVRFVFLPQYSTPKTVFYFRARPKSWHEERASVVYNFIAFSQYD